MWQLGLAKSQSDQASEPISGVQPHQPDQSDRLLPPPGQRPNHADNPKEKGPREQLRWPIVALRSQSRTFVETLSASLPPWDLGHESLTVIAASNLLSTTRPNPTRSNCTTGTITATDAYQRALVPLLNKGQQDTYTRPVPGHKRMACFAWSGVHAVLCQELHSQMSWAPNELGPQ